MNNFRQGINSLFDLSIDAHKPIDEITKNRLKATVTHDYPQVEVGMNTFVDQLIDYINDRDANPKPNPLLLMGPTGVGKTRLVEDILCKGSNLHVHKVSLANLTSEQLAGDESANLCNKYNEGIIFRAVVEAVRNNREGPVIIFLTISALALPRVEKKLKKLL